MHTVYAYAVKQLKDPETWHNVMMTSSNGNIFRVTDPLWGKSTGHRWRGALMFSLTCTWTNGWASNRDACDMRSHRADYAVVVLVLVTKCMEAGFGHLIIMWSSEWSKSTDIEFTERTPVKYEWDSMDRTGDFTEISRSGNINKQ